jgi:hypothetical protein
VKRADGERKESEDLGRNNNGARRKHVESSDLSGCLGKDIDSMRGCNDALMDRNHELKQELEALQHHADLLGGQNLDLQRELDSFVETDDVVRKNLDRKERI